MKPSTKKSDKKLIYNGQTLRYVGCNRALEYYEDHKGYLFCMERFNEDRDPQIIRCGHRSEYNQITENNRFHPDGCEVHFEYKTFTERIEATQKRKRILKQELQARRSELIRLPEASGKRDRLQAQIQDLEQEENRIKTHIELLLIFTGDRNTNRKEEEHA